ncbi:MAG: hypothetical protein K2X81_15240 [Candidatus Obscuribacterales bacterium]|nr:hypothetical protein [Candidatus Obscuribacterales bacterium]
MEKSVELHAEPLLQKTADSSQSKFAQEAWEGIVHHKTEVLLGAAAIGVVAAGSVGAKALFRALDNGTKNLARFTGAEESPLLRPFLGNADRHVPGTFKETSSGVVKDQGLDWHRINASNPPKRWDGAHMDYQSSLANAARSSDNAFFAHDFEGFANASSDDVAVHELSHGFLMSPRFTGGQIEELYDLRAHQFFEDLKKGAGKAEQDGFLSHTKWPLDPAEHSYRGDFNFSRRADFDNVDNLLTLAHEIPHARAAFGASSKAYTDYIEKLTADLAPGKRPVPQFNEGPAIKAQLFEMPGIASPLETKVDDLVERSRIKAFFRSCVDGVAGLKPKS